MTMPRTLTLTLCVIVAAWAAGSAQAPPRASSLAAAVPSGTASLAGVVKDVDGARVRRASVTIEGDMHLQRLAITDGDGRFAFEDLPAGRFTISAEKRGYPKMSYGARRPFRAGSGLFLQDGQQVRDLSLTLAKGAVLAGIVYDHHGVPLPGVPVMAWEFRASLAGVRTLDYPSTGPVTVITDDRGQYRIFGLAPGDYTIGTSWYYQGLGYDVRVPSDDEIRAAFQAGSVQPPRTEAPSPPAADRPRYNFAPVFAPGVVDPMIASAFTLGAGEIREGVDLRMVFQPMSSIEGEIASPDGAPVNGRLTIARRSPIEALNTGQVRSATARFTVESLGPGPYLVMAEVAAKPGAPALWAMADVMAVSGQRVPVSLVLQPALTVTGRLVFDGAALKPPQDMSQVALYLRAVGRTDPQMQTKVDPAGSFTISGVIPGQYRIVAGVPGAAASGPSWSLRSVMLDGGDVTDRPFEIGASGSTGLTIAFTDAVSELSGTLTTAAGTPAADHFVIVTPADRTYWLPQSRRIVSTRPDPSGRYLFRRLPAGDYRVAVTTDLVPRDLQDANALEQLLAQSAAVTIGLGEKKTLDLRVGGMPHQPMSGVRGR